MSVGAIVLVKRRQGSSDYVQDYTIERPYQSEGDFNPTNSTPEGWRNPPDQKAVGDQQQPAAEIQAEELTPQLQAALSLAAQQWEPSDSPQFREHRAYADKGIAAVDDATLKRIDRYIGEDVGRVAEVLTLAAKFGKMLGD